MRYLIKIERSAKLASLYGPGSAYLKERGKPKEFPTLRAAEEEAQRLQAELADDDGQLFVKYVAVAV
jgi:hypothetical protein